MTRNRRLRARPVIAICLLSLLQVPATGLGQSTQGDPVDLEFEIINATTGQPTSIERLQIEYSTHVLNPVLDTEPEGSAFTLQEVPIKDVGKYILTAWKQDVPYFWSVRGRDLLSGPVTLHVFDVDANVDAVKLVGLNLLLRKGESVVELEYMIQAENSARPQVTVWARPTFELQVPAGARNFAAHYTRGPEPIAIPVNRLGPDRVGLDVPLTTGRNAIRLTCAVAWQEGLTIPVGASVPVEAWSLLATPENLDIRGRGLESAPGQDIPGHLRYKGSALEANQAASLEIRGRVPSGPAAEVFDSEAPAAEDPAAPAAEENDGSGFPLPVAIAILVVIIAVIARRRRS